MFFVVVLVMVYAHDNGQVFAFGRCADNNLFSPGFDVSPGLRGVGKAASGLDNQVYAKLAPGQVSRVSFGQNLQRIAVNFEGIAFNFDFPIEEAVVAVVLQQVSKGFGVGEVVYGHDFYFIGVFFDQGPVGLPTNPAKTIDTDLYSHCFLSPLCFTVARLTVGSEF